MRKVFGFVSALAGGYLLWSAFKFVRVLFILKDQSIDGAMMTIAAVMAVIGVGLLALGWYLFSDPIKKPPPAQPPQSPGVPPQP